MSVQEIKNQLNNLTLEERFEVYRFLGEKLKRIEHLKSVLESIKGRGKNVYGMDAQEYINKLRTDDRF